MAKDLRSQFNEWSRWDSLRKWGSSPLVRSSLAFFVAGYLLLWNEKFQDYLTIKFDTHFSLWRIWMIYYGSICLAVATTLYSLFCPKPIKDHGTAFELAQSECQHLATMGLGEKYLEDVKQLEDSCNEAERRLLPPDRPPNNDVMFFAHKPEMLASLIIYAWRLHNIKHPRTRLLIFLIYCIGFALLGIPAVVTFAQVTRFALRQIP